jgi:hypothetical protein
MADRPLREWPLEQLAEQASLHATDAAALDALAFEARHRRGVRAKALEARLARMIAACPTAPAAAPAVDQAARLRVMLAAAAREIATLRARLAALEVGGEAGPHRRVHLTPDAPAWLVSEVRRAYRRRYHPDAATDQQHRRRSEEVFKRAEAVFAAIEDARGA